MLNQKDLEHKIKNLIERKIEEENRRLMIYNAVYQSLEPFDGKKITKRIETAVKKALPEYTVYYKKESYGSYDLLVWRFKYDDHLRFSLGSDITNKYTPGTIVLSEFEEMNACYGSAAIERIEQRQAILKNRIKAIARATYNLIKAHNEYNEINGSSFENPDCYDINGIVEEFTEKLIS